MIPQQLNGIAACIERSRYILELEEDWDGEGASACDPAVWERAVAFVAKTARRLLETQQRVMLAPEITHGPAGSIDFLWERDGRQLLVNYPAQAGEPISYYGRTPAGDEAKGAIPSGGHPALEAIYLRLFGSDEP